MVIERVASGFGLGRLVEPPAVVPGGLSNDLWRLVTDQAVFAVKRMVVNAGRADFVANVETAFAVERRAFAAGVPMPQPVPVPSTGRALARVAGSLFRVHRWLDGDPGTGSAPEAAELLAAVHATGEPRWAGPPEAAWSGVGWGADVARLAARVSVVPDRVLVVDSHRDLDRKNTMRRRRDGVLAAVDWDAAGPVGAVHEAVAVALDWADGDTAVFAAAVAAYTRVSGVTVPPQPWVFAGWVAAQGGWLDYNAAHRTDTPLGRAEVAGTLTRLRAVADGIDDLLDSVR